MTSVIMPHAKVTLTVVIACYNEERTLEARVERVRNIADENLALEIIVVDDHSTNRSVAIAMQLEEKHREVLVVRHERNRGEGAPFEPVFREPQEILWQSKMPTLSITRRI
jgi:dolichol-phosphate mannosyltransferase